MNDLPETREPAAPVIRLIRDEEIAAVRELTVAAYTSSYDIDFGGEYIVELGRVAERARAHQVWIAEDRASGELLGTVTTPLPGRQLSAFADPLDMDFRLLAVADAARGRGIGTALVRHCADLALAHGARRLVLHTSGDMGLAVALYERLGFDRLPEVEESFPFSPGDCYPVRVYARVLDAAGSARECT